MTATRKREIYLSSAAGSDADSGANYTVPLRSGNVASLVYGARPSVDTVLRLACGERYYGWSEPLRPKTGALLRLEPYERSPGDFDRLGPPIISGGARLTQWQQHTASGLWYTDEAVLPLLPAKAADNFVPAFPFGFFSRGVLMLNGAVLKRRDGMRIRGGTVGTNNIFYTGVFNPATGDRLAEDEWALDLSRIDPETGVGIQRVYLGERPMDAIVELSVNERPIAFAEPVNLELVNLTLACSWNNNLSPGTSPVQARRILLDECTLIGSGNNCLAVVGGAVYTVRKTKLLHACNNNFTHSQGEVSVLLLENVEGYNHPSFGVLPNGMIYDDRCSNDMFTLHGRGGAYCSLINLRGRNARENLIDVQDLYQKVLIRGADMSAAGQNVGVFNSPVRIEDSRFSDSARGLSFKFHNGAGYKDGYPYNLNATAAGSQLDLVVVVNCGNPARGAPGGAAGIELEGPAGTAAIEVSRSHIVGSPNSSRPLIVVSHKRETRTQDLYPELTFGDWYEPCPLHIGNGTTLDTNGGDPRVIEIRPSTTAVPPPPELPLSLIQLRETTIAPGGTFVANGVQYNLDRLATLYGHRGNKVEAISYHQANPLTPDQVVDPTVPLAAQMGPAYARRVHLVPAEPADPTDPPPPSPELVAAFRVDKVAGTVPVVVHAEDLSTGGPGAWEWMLNGRPAATSQNPTFVIDTPGTYGVTLRVRRGTDEAVLERPALIVAQAAPVPEPPPPKPVQPSILDLLKGLWRLRCMPDQAMGATGTYGPQVTTPRGAVGNAFAGELELATDGGGIFRLPFHEGPQPANGWTNTSITRSGIPYISTDTRQGRAWFKIHLHKTKPGHSTAIADKPRWRGEVTHADPDRRVAWGERVWSPFGVLVTDEEVFVDGVSVGKMRWDTIAPGDEIIVYQWHAATNSTIDNPPMSVRIARNSTAGLHLYVQIYRTAANGSGPRETAKFWVVPLTLNEPLDGIFDCVPSYLDEGHVFNGQRLKPYVKLWTQSGNNALSKEMLYEGRWSYPGGTRAHWVKTGGYYQASTALWTGSEASATNRLYRVAGLAEWRHADVAHLPMSPQLGIAALRGLAEIPVSPPPPPPSGAWEQIAVEWQSFGPLPAGSRVRFGIDDRWVEKMVEGTGQCHSQWFGQGNPAPGVTKVCQLFRTDAPGDGDPGGEDTPPGGDPGGGDDGALSPPNAAPTNLRITGVTGTTVSWACDKMSGASSYELQWAWAGNATRNDWKGAKAGGSFATNAGTISGVDQGLPVLIRARSVNSKGAGPWAVVADWVRTTWPTVPLIDSMVSPTSITSLVVASQGQTFENVLLTGNGSIVAPNGVACQVLNSGARLSTVADGNAAVIYFQGDLASDRKRVLKNFHFDRCEQNLKIWGHNTDNPTFAARTEIENVHVVSPRWPTRFDWPMAGFASVFRIAPTDDRYISFRFVVLDLMTNRQPSSKEGDVCNFNRFRALGRGFRIYGVILRGGSYDTDAEQNSSTLFNCGDQDPSNGAVWLDNVTLIQHASNGIGFFSGGDPGGCSRVIVESDTPTNAYQTGFGVNLTSQYDNPVDKKIVEDVLVNQRIWFYGNNGGSADYVHFGGQNATEVAALKARTTMREVYAGSIGTPAQLWERGTGLKWLPLPSGL